MFYYLIKLLESTVNTSTLAQTSIRAMLAGLSSLLVTILIGPILINKLTNMQVGQVVRQNGPESHFVKSGTPTMGGALIILVVSLSTLLFADLSNMYIWLLLFVLLGCGALGWMDDYKKLILKDSRGLHSKAKLLWQSIVAIVPLALIYFYADNDLKSSLYVPLLNNCYLELGLLFLVLGYFVIVGTSNAVNLTDGLDGLAILPVAMVTAALAIFAYISGNQNFAEYFSMPYIPHANELVVFCAALVGSSIGFLWFNAYPAQIFMGDVGALSLGAVLGTIAVIIKQELILFIMGGVFVAETLSVMLQVGSYKLRKKRIFKMAPIHHHFELMGWPEPRVIVRFWIITCILVLLGLVTIKIR